MAVETAAVNDAALNLLDLRDTDRVLEIGFGHGHTIERAAQRVRSGSVAGVDHSEAMLHVASRRCAALIAAGRVRLHCADSTHLPFANDSFDKALAVHTLYFWQPPAPHLREIRRVLAPGGQIVLAFRPAGTRGAADFPSDVYTFYSPEDVHDLLAMADFTAVETIEHSPELVFMTARTPATAVTPPLVPER
jgi:ubiquinone/menaquinone biosynthesis C-methylase UbiE